MSEYVAVVVWDRRDARFVDGRYSRAHRWEFDGGTIVPASSSPHVVPVPLSDAHAVDPEEAFVASLASCHMLWFLSIAAKRGYCVETYRDRALGVMDRGANGRPAMTAVTLHPHTIFGPGAEPTAQDLAAMHEEAHRECFIANSVTTRLSTIPTFAIASANGPSSR
ncbi:MAG: OsmC family protein [Gemmatimonadales bacterium]